MSGELAAQPGYVPMLASMLQVAERTGQLEQSLDEVANFCDSELQSPRQTAEHDGRARDYCFCGCDCWLRVYGVLYGADECRRKHPMRSVLARTHSSFGRC